VAEAQQVLDEGIEQTVNLGNALSELARGVKISQIAAQSKFLSKHLPEVSLEYITPPEIHYEPGRINGSFRFGQTNVSAVMGKVELQNFTFASVRSYLEKTPSLEITTKGWVFDFNA
jgi:hypothetical protein